MTDVSVNPSSSTGRTAGAAPRGGGLGSAARSEVTRAAGRVERSDVGREARRTVGTPGDGFEARAAAEARGPEVTRPSRIEKIDARKMTVNTDGAGERNGRHFQPRTSFQVRGEYLDAQSQSFMALRPQEMPAGAKMGDPVEVTIKGARVYDEALRRDRQLPDQTVYGILGDMKGRSHAAGVEGSTRMHDLLGSTASPRSGTIQGDVSVRVAVGAGRGLVGQYGSGPGRIPTEAQIQDYARRVFTGQ